MKIPRILLAAGASGSGKTLITCGLLQALVNRGMKTASFKCGPDYIDPMFHSRVIGTKSRNLDTFFTGEELTRYLLMENSKDQDIAVMEGVMGYYDGAGGTTVKASAYDLARVTRTPVIFIVNSKGMSLSLAAYLKGFLEYRKDSRIQGVIFNQMSPMLYPRMKKLVEQELSVKVLGYVPRVEDCVIESRHLGLVLPHEIPQLKERLQKLAGILEDTLDIEGILSLAGQADQLSPVCPGQVQLLPKLRCREPVSVGVAADEAFCFFYEDNFRLLEALGGRLVPFSPLKDPHLPKGLHGLLLYGGYPELYAQALEENTSMRREIKEALEQGMPCMAECGGFMYLHETLEDMQGVPRKGAGVIRGAAYRTRKLSRFGYITARQQKPVFGEENLGPVPAHEFHYFDSTCCGDAFYGKKPESTRGWECIHGSDTLCAGFPHFYYYGNPSLPAAFLRQCEKYKKAQQRSST